MNHGSDTRSARDRRCRWLRRLADLLDEVEEADQAVTTYFLQANGTAPNKEAAVGTPSDLSTFMNSDVHNLEAELFAEDDKLRVCSEGGAFSPFHVAAFGVTYEGDGPDKPRITGLTPIAGWTIYQGTTWQATVPTEPRIVTFGEVVLIEGSDADTLGDNEWCWINGVLYVNTDNPSPIQATQTDDLFARKHGFIPERITAKNLHLVGSNGHAFRVWGDDWTLDGMEVDLSYEDGIVAFDPRGKRVQILNTRVSTCYGPNADNIHLWNTDGFVVRGCALSMKGSVNTKGNLHTSGESSGLVEQNDMGFGRFGADVCGSNVVVQDNRLHDHTGAAWAADILCGISQDTHGNSYRRNVCLSSVNGVYLFGGNRAGFDFGDNGFFDYSNAALLVDTQLALSGSFKNSVMRSAGARSISIDANVALGGWVSDYNFLGPESPGFIQYQGRTYDTLADYTAAESQDTHSMVGEVSNPPESQQSEERVFEVRIREIVET